ncbi:MAG: LapA family protein [Alphaproteobacteria bacterium]|nr:LapA family protein [Alphaproteobacteria bacterium]
MTLADALKLLITVPFILILLWICFANRGEVSLVWNPLQAAENFPLAVILTGAVFFGFLWGSLIMWINGLPARLESRARKREITRLQKELAVTPLQPPVS